MFTFRKLLGRITDVKTTTRKRVALWWLTMSDEEQRDVYKRSGATVACGLMACMLLPAISERYETERVEADFRSRAVSFALGDTAQDAINSQSDAAQLLEHPWLHSVGDAIERSPRASLSRNAMYARDDAAILSVMANRLKQADEAERILQEHDCLTKAVYYEAGFQEAEGKLAVAEVIMNRAADHRYPNSVCGVVFQGATRTTGCQFTFTCDGALRRKPNQAAYEKASIVAAHVLMGLNEPKTGSATHYHATYVDPVWNAGLVRTGKIGAHIFYRFPRGQEWAKARNAVAEKQAYRARLAAFEKRGAEALARTAELDGGSSLQLSDTTTAPAP